LIVLGKTVEGTTLVPIRLLARNEVVCKCIICGTEDVYKKTYLEEHSQKCRYCTDVKSLGVDKLGKYGELKVLLAQEEAIVQRKFRGVKAGEKYVESYESDDRFPLGSILGDLKIIGYIGKWGINYKYLKKESLVLSCENCHFTRFEKMKPALMKQKFNCPNCTKLKAQARDNVESKKSSEANHRRVIEANQIERNTEKEFNQSGLDLEEADKRKRLNKHIKKICELNPNHAIVGVTVRGSGYSTSVVCNKCGTLSIINNSNRNKPVVCVGCAKMRDNPNYVGVLFRDYVHSVHNMLEITKQYKGDNDIPSCDVRCIGCGKEKSDISLYNVINNKVFCDCPKSSLLMVCDKCYKMFEIPMKEVINSNTQERICPDCGKVFTDTDIKNESYLYDNKMSLKKKLESLDSELNDKDDTKMKPRTRLVSNNLIKEERAIYAGIDGNMYYRCMCTTHNISLVLNDDEILNYNHERCDDARSELIPRINTENLRM